MLYTSKESLEHVEFRFRMKKYDLLKKKLIFSKESTFLHLNLNSTCSKLSFEVHNIGFAQNFQIFNFLPINFPSITNFIR